MLQTNFFMILRYALGIKFAPFLRKHFDLSSLAGAENGQLLISFGVIDFLLSYWIN